MAKVLSFNKKKAVIGTSSGGLKEVPMSAFGDYEPEVGDEVEIYQEGKTIMVVPKDKSEQEQDERYVNKTAYCVLALFFGWVGFHKFYVGKPGLGIIYLLFCPTLIPFIISLIEFLVGLCTPADKYGNFCR